MLIHEGTVESSSGTEEGDDYTHTDAIEEDFLFRLETALVAMNKGRKKPGGPGDESSDSGDEANHHHAGLPLDLPPVALGIEIASDWYRDVALIKATLGDWYFL